MSNSRKKKKPSNSQIPDEVIESVLELEEFIKETSEPIIPFD